MTDLYRKLTQKLKDSNFVFWREGKGSHEIWVNIDTNVKVSVSKNTKSRHTANGVLKSAGIDDKI